MISSVNRYNPEHIHNHKGISAVRTFMYVLLFLSFLLSMNLWIGWENRSVYLNTAIIILLALIIGTNRIKLDCSFTNVGMFVITVIAYALVSGVHLVFPVSALSFFLVICLNDYDKIACLRFITKWFGYLMIPCLLTYWLCSVLDLPSLGIQRANLNDWAIREGYGVCKNYIFYMQSIYYEGRFNGPFLEPGHVGMISAFLLFVNRFDFKRKGMWFILLGLGFTLSLAGYVLLFIGFLMILFYKGKIKLKHMIGYSILFFTIYLCIIYYNEGENILYEKIISRLEYDENKGFRGNNRIFGQISLYYAAMWKNTHTLLWGYPKEVIEWLAVNGSRGTGFFMWMCQHGLIGTIAIALMYVFYALRSKAKLFAMLAIVFVALMFWQRSYPFWSSWLICFVYGIVAEENRLKGIKEKGINEDRNLNLPPQP